MLQLRKDAARALAAVRRGEPLLLTYRGRPVARIEPVRAEARVDDDDALRRLDAFAVDGPRGALANRTIDRLVYGA